DERTAERRRIGCRSRRHAPQEIPVGYEQAARHQVVQYALHAFALSRETRNARLDVRDMFGQRAELAALVQRLQHLEGHHVRVAASLDLEHALVVRERGDHTVFRREHRRIEIDAWLRRNDVAGVLERVLWSAAHRITGCVATSANRAWRVSR